jgi:cytochrome c peroxidase
LKFARSVAALCFPVVAGCSDGGTGPAAAAEAGGLHELVLPDQPAVPADASNQFADDEAAAALGHQLFVDPRFSGPLLDAVNDGTTGTLGLTGETGKVACSSCHIPESGSFVDNRSPRAQLSLASSWTHRRAPPLLDVAQGKLLMWDGRRDSLHSVVFNAIESPLEFNSSRLFVAQQVAALYRAPYEAIFGPLPPSVESYAVLAASDAGCSALPQHPLDEHCTKPGDDDDGVIRVVVNFGKAVAAYLRHLTCGPSRFDTWVNGDASALSEEEAAGAELFLKSGCTSCHSGPYFSDQRFHNIGHTGDLIPFTGVDTRGDRGAALGIVELLADPLNSRGAYSDGDDDRLDAVPIDLSLWEGAFRTRSLRCVSQRPSFLRDGMFRTLNDVVRFFSAGGEPNSTVGTSELVPLDLTSEERGQIVAFLQALDGPGPAPEWIAAPALP